MHFFFLTNLKNIGQTRNGVPDALLPADAVIRYSHNSKVTDFARWADQKLPPLAPPLDIDGISFIFSVFCETFLNFHLVLFIYFFKKNLHYRN